MAIREDAWVSELDDNLNWVLRCRKCPLMISVNLRSLTRDMDSFDVLADLASLTRAHLHRETLPVPIAELDSIQF